MNWDRIEGNSKQFKGQAKEQWGKLTDDDFDRAAGRRDQLAGRIQERYGVAKDEAEREIDTWLARSRKCLCKCGWISLGRQEWRWKCLAVYRHSMAIEAWNSETDCCR